jgi:hypothetical protein
MRVSFYFVSLPKRQVMLHFDRSLMMWEGLKLTGFSHTRQR